MYPVSGLFIRKLYLVHPVFGHIDISFLRHKHEETLQDSIYFNSLRSSPQSCRFYIEVRSVWLVTVLMRRPTPETMCSDWKPLSPLGDGDAPYGVNWKPFVGDFPRQNVPPLLSFLLICCVLHNLCICAVLCFRFLSKQKQNEHEEVFDLHLHVIKNNSY